MNPCWQLIRRAVPHRARRRHHGPGIGRVRHVHHVRHVRHWVHHWRWVCAAVPGLIPTLPAAAPILSPPPVVVSATPAPVIAGPSSLPWGGGFWPIGYEAGPVTSAAEAFENVPQSGLEQRLAAAVVEQGPAETMEIHGNSIVGPPAIPTPEPSSAALLAAALAAFVLGATKPKR